jgi:hypothetical protein
MPKQQRAVRIEQKGQMAAIQQLETKSDEELAAETRYRAAAQALLGARAAERYDAPAARAHYERAIAAARPQERMQIRRMADANLAIAERRVGDIKAAAERLGVEAPSGRQLFGMRVLGVVAPPKSAGIFARIRGIVVVLAAIVAIVALAFGIVKLIALPFGGLSLDLSIFYAIVLFFVAIGVAVYLGRRRQHAALAKRDADRAARLGG